MHKRSMGTFTLYLGNVRHNANCDRVHNADCRCTGCKMQTESKTLFHGLRHIVNFHGVHLYKSALLGATNLI